MKTFKEFILETSGLVTSPQVVKFYDNNGTFRKINYTLADIKDGIRVYVDEDGYLHNVSGPAWEGSIGVDYHIHGKQYSKEEFEDITKNVDTDNIKDISDIGDLF